MSKKEKSTTGKTNENHKKRMIQTFPISSYVPKKTLKLKSNNDTFKNGNYNQITLMNTDLKILKRLF